MRRRPWFAAMIGLGVAGVMLGVDTPIAAAQTATSPAGTWRGPFVGSVFTFEFKSAPTGWTGRSMSEKGGKWIDLRSLTVSDREVRFSIESQPPSLFILKLDAAGKTLSGTAQFGEHPPLPLSLDRIS